jgi:hypothetical protein
MSKIIRISNIEKYNIEMIDGVLVLKPKNLKSDDEYIARSMILEYYLYKARWERFDYEYHDLVIKEIDETREKKLNDDDIANYRNKRNCLDKKMNYCSDLMDNIKKRFLERFEDTLWDTLRCDYPSI